MYTLREIIICLKIPRKNRHISFHRRGEGKKQNQTNTDQPPQKKPNKQPISSSEQKSQIQAHKQDAWTEAQTLVTLTDSVDLKTLAAHTVLANLGETSAAKVRAT